MKGLFAKAQLIPRPKVFFIATALIFICLVPIAYKLRLKGESENTGISLLKEVYKNHRSVESRVADFSYAALISTRGKEESAPDTLLVDRTERVLLDAVYYEPGAQSHRALGVFHLINKRFDKAIKEFEQALTY